MRDDTLDWLLEAEQQEARANEILDLALQARPKLDVLPAEKKRDLLELLDVQVVVTSDVPGALRGGSCAFEEWFHREGRLVPPQLTEDQWAQVEALFPRPKKQTRVVPPRVAFEASLYKARHGLMWKDLPDEITLGHRPQSLYQKALGYLKTGVWERAVLALGECAGSPVPPLYGLPDLHITGTFDPRLSGPPRGGVTSEDAAGPEGAPALASNCSWPTRASSTATTGRSCAPCSAAPPTAD
ncbi:transposase [Streptomyces sp. TN58]|uniref:transposase n=1 Tax=Streptomyces sp. TN58 TaxID=234612 RepID=UPI001F354ECB|nr:transposase [Streptomyces sp. TN58]